MVTLSKASMHLLISDHLSSPVISSPGFTVYLQKRRELSLKAPCFNTFLAKDSVSLGFGVVRRRGGRGSWCCWCKGWEESDGEARLEAEIFEFMKKSDKPQAFPTKKELENGGRMDLVDAILKKGGWLSMGWDSSDDENDENEEFIGHCSESSDLDIADFQDRVESLQESSNSFKEGEVESAHSSQLASPSGRAVVMILEDDTGIEGILYRLEKERNLSFGINLGSNGYQANASSTIEVDKDHTKLVNSTCTDRADLKESDILTSGSPAKSKFDSLVGKPSSNRSLSDINHIKYSFNPDMWRTWSRQRAGFTDAEFEAAEICFKEDHVEGKNENSQDERLSITGNTTEAIDKWSEFNHNHIRTRLQHLELELASALHLLRSKNEEIAHKGSESTSSDLQKLSDAWEFQENEIMNSQNRLRSIRAQLAILEGKMALAIIESQKIVEEKQKRIDGARRALQLLRTVSIVWPNSASKVLLTGSYDGWTTQRKMEKSRTGIFSVCLQLYPGRYEIKFIVDGKWKCDPLRPIVHNNGYENNLLIIT